MRRVYLSGRIRLELLQDPETPVMVIVRGPDGEGSATFECALETGEADGYDLTERELTWLRDLRPIADKWFDDHRVVS